MRSGDEAGGAVFGREIVQQPDRIGHEVTRVVGDGAAIGVQRLAARRVRIRGPRVQAAQFEARSQNVRHAFEHARREDHVFEDRALVHQIGQAPRFGLLFEFAAGPSAFFGEEFLDPAAQRAEQLRRHQAGQDEIPLLVELAAIGVGQHKG